MIAKTIEASLFTNFICKYKQLNVASTSDLTNKEQNNFQEKQELISNINNNNNSKKAELSTLTSPSGILANTKLKAKQPKTMNANLNMKLKSIWYSLFQAQNNFFIQKSMRPISTLEDNDDEYRVRRRKNNDSVRKSREKSRIKIEECRNHVQKLKTENTQLNQVLDSLQKELYTLKDLFQHCFNSFNLNKLPVKPSDIPTSTLQKIIMPQQAKSAEITPSKQVEFTETDKYYVNHLKSAVSNVLSSEGVSAGNAPSPVSTVPLSGGSSPEAYFDKALMFATNVSRDHDYSKRLSSARALETS